MPPRIFIHNSKYRTLIQTAPLRWDDPNSFHPEDYCIFLWSLPSGHRAAASYSSLEEGWQVTASVSSRWEVENKTKAWPMQITLVKVTRGTDNVTQRRTNNLQGTLAIFFSLLAIIYTLSLCETVQFMLKIKSSSKVAEKMRSGEEIAREGFMVLSGHNTSF